MVDGRSAIGESAGFVPFAAFAAGFAVGFAVDVALLFAAVFVAVGSIFAPDSR